MRVVCAMHRGSALGLFLAGACAAMTGGCAPSATQWTPATVAPPPVQALNIPVPQPLISQSQPIQVPADAPDGARLDITRDGAILTGLLGNRTIRVARFGPDIDATAIDEARGVFDPRVLAQVSAGRTSSRATLPLSAASGGSASAGNPEAGSVEALLRQVQRLYQSTSAFETTTYSTAATGTGSVTMEQYLPTGTLLFLTGGTVETAHDDRGLRGAWSVGLTQPLLRGGDMLANLAGLRQARNRAAGSEYAFRREVIETVRQIDVGYWELVLARQVLSIRQFGVKLAEQQTKREEDLLSVGKALRGDVMTASAERSARQADLVDAQAFVESQTIDLIRLMHPEDAVRWDLTLNPLDPAEVTEIQPVPETSEALAFQYRPELAQARLTLANLELNERQARNSRLPQLDLVGIYGADHDSPALSARTTDAEYQNEAYSVGLQFETALLNRSENARYRRARLENQQGAAILVELEESIAAEVRRAVVEVRRQWQRLLATAETVLSRKEAVRVVQGRREVGKATNLDVLQVQRDFIESQVDDATARVRYIQALTELYAAEGTLLERRGIALDDAQTIQDMTGISAHAKF